VGMAEPISDQSARGERSYARQDIRGIRFGDALPKKETRASVNTSGLRFIRLPGELRKRNPQRTKSADALLPGRLQN